MRAVVAVEVEFTTTTTSTGTGDDDRTVQSVGGAARASATITLI